MQTHRAEGTYDEELALREVEHLARAIDHDEAESDQGISRPQRETRNEELEKRGHA